MQTKTQTSYVVRGLQSVRNDYLFRPIIYLGIPDGKLSPGREVDGVKEVGIFLFFWQFVK